MMKRSPTQRLPTGPSRASASGAALDPQALMRIKNLELRARSVVEGFLTGLHRSPHHGFSVEFTEYRQYSPGDDPRYLDWRLYARTDRYYLKRFEDETNLRCYLLVDMSRSMSFGSLPYTKVEYARTAAATLAYFLALQRDAVGLMTFDRTVSEFIPARFRTGHLHRLLVCLEKETAGTATDITAPLEQTARLVAKRGLVVLISDLLAPLDALEQNLGYLRTRGHDCIVLRILDPAERTLSFAEPSLFVDAETGREIYVEPADAAAEYQRRFAEHTARVREICSNLGIDFVELDSDQPLEFALFHFIQARSRRGRTVARRAGSTRRA